MEMLSESFVMMVEDLVKRILIGPVKAEAKMVSIIGCADN
jgi:hypothetical protein